YDQYLASATLASHGNGVQTEATGSLDYHGLAHPNPGEVPATGHLCHGAIHPSHDLVRQFVGHLEHHVVRVQVEVVAKGALEVRPHLARARPRMHPIRTRPVATVHARSTAAAREEVREDHPVANRQR